MRTITADELRNLLRVLSMDVTLQSVDDSFNTFFSKTDYFRVGCSICILLQDQMLTAPQVRFYFNLLQIADGLLCSCYLSAFTDPVLLACTVILALKELALKLLTSSIYRESRPIRYYATCIVQSLQEQTPS